MSLRLWLVRHATTDLVDAGRLNGWEDVPLNELGQIEAAAIQVPERRWVGVWASDLVRAQQTARIAGFDPIVDRVCANSTSDRSKAWRGINSRRRPKGP